MKATVKLPNTDKIISELISKEPAKAVNLLKTSGVVDKKGRYLHWDKLRHLSAPPGLSSEEWWAGVKYARGVLYKNISLYDKKGAPFKFSLPDCVLRELHWVDKNASGNIATDKPITNPHTRNTYLVSSLVNEAINSSQLEGASTTRNVAKDMLREGRSPLNKSEQMIFNNYQAMQFIRDLKTEELTPSIVLEMQKILTKDTLDDPDSAGNFRMDKDSIHVVDALQEVLHIPPPASELEKRMQQLCAFANDKTLFIHPVIKAILLHFMLAYDHPFVEGNGRTARALFYWYMANQEYWLMEFISISGIIKQSPGKYKEAYLYTETDDSDTTYFIIHQLEVIKKAIANLHHYLDKKAQEIQDAEGLIIGTRKLQGKLNYRQLAILRNALEHPGAMYKIKTHQNTHNVTYETARADLTKMADKLKLLDKEKIGKEFIFVSPSDIQKRLEKFKK